MKTPGPLFLLLASCLLQVPTASAGDKKKDKMAEWQKEQWKKQQYQQQYQQQQQQPVRRRGTWASPSRQSNIPVRLIVVNRTSVPLSVFWIDFYGNPTPCGIARSGGSVDVDTYAGHSWQIRTSQDLLKSYVTSGRPVQQIIVTPGGVKVAQSGEAPAVVIANQDPNDITAGNGAAIHRIEPAPMAPEPQPLNDPAPAQPDTSLDEAAVAQAEFLRVHNQARAVVGVPSLQWSSKLAQSAQDWADQLEATGKFAHNPATPFGENLAARTPPLTPSAAARMWLEEKKKFEAGKTDFNEVGHYTQMVWNGTTHVGYGTSTVQGMTVVVANYEPAGNLTGQSPF